MMNFKMMFINTLWLFGTIVILGLSTLIIMAVANVRKENKLKLEFLKKSFEVYEINNDEEDQLVSLAYCK